MPMLRNHFSTEFNYSCLEKVQFGTILVLPPAQFKCPEISSQSRGARGRRRGSAAVALAACLASVALAAPSPQPRPSPLSPLAASPCCPPPSIAVPSCCRRSPPSAAWLLRPRPEAIAAALLAAPTDRRSCRVSPPSAAVHCRAKVAISAAVSAHPHRNLVSFLWPSPPPHRLRIHPTFHRPNTRASAMATSVPPSPSPQQLTITRPDDWHLHLRDGLVLAAVLPHSAKHFERAIVMPNLKPPVTTTARAVEYREEIMRALTPGSSFTPLMTLYLTDTTSPEEIKVARKSGVVFAVKLYPAGATTNSQDGVTDILGKCLPVLEEMVRQDMPLLVHGEVTDPHVDTFDREKVFIERILAPLVQRLPQLKIVMEHITTMDAVNFVESCKGGNVAATVTPQHLLLNRNALFQGGLQPHNYCLPVLKRETHRQAIVSAVTSGSRQYFLGTDSAPHDKRMKECSCGCAGIYSAPVALSLYAKVFEQAGALDKLEAFTSFNGPDFYGLPRNSSKIILRRSEWKVPATYTYGAGLIVPMSSGNTLEWLPSDEPEE